MTHEPRPSKTTQDALACIQELLARMQSESSSGGTAAYVPGPRATEGEIAAWELANGVVLPEEYRLFLREVGNGGRMPGDYCDFEVTYLWRTEAGPGLTTPFPITKDRLCERLDQLAVEGRANVGHLFPELDHSWEAGVPPGCLAVGGYPGGDGVFLVVTGELRGMVWCSVSGGVPEFDDFLSWFEAALLDLWEGAR